MPPPDRPEGPIRVVADLGNTRLKWALVGPDRRPSEVRHLPPDDPARWDEVFRGWGLTGARSRWTISSVNPPLADRLAAFLGTHPGAEARWLRSAADVRVAHRLRSPGTTGADRALAVIGALRERPTGGPLQVVCCGTAITVEAVDPGGVWLGGAIAPGLRLLSEALHRGTAQLPRSGADRFPDPPSPVGDSTGPAIEAGIYSAVIGTVRELLDRQAARWEEPPVVCWAGGDAEWIAPAVDRPRSTIRPDLVLEALAALDDGGP